MALTKVSRGLLSTGIVDNSNATAITIDSSENVGIGTSSPSSYFAGATNLVIAGSGDSGLTVASGTSSMARLLFADGTSGDDRYRGYIAYSHASNSMSFATDATERMRIDSTGLVHSSVQYTGGFGAQTTSGTDDFNHISNAVAGNGFSLLQGVSTNGPGGTAYFHIFNYEYVSKNGTGNMTQLAYGYNSNLAYMRFRLTGSWSSWVALH